MMAFKLRAIETEYDGRLFRSRLEARWAVFFNSLRIPYEYEKEGFELGEAGRYLPDFWLPEQGCWVEIKGQEPNKDEIKKAGHLSALSGKSVYVFWGQITIPHESIICIGGYCLEQDDDIGVPSPIIDWDILSDDSPYGDLWCECPECSHFKIASGYPGDKNFCPNCKHDLGYHHGTAKTSRLVNAYTTAIQARFERYNKKPSCQPQNIDPEIELKNELKQFCQQMSLNEKYQYAKQLIEDYEIPDDFCNYELEDSFKRQEEAHIEWLLFRILSEWGSVKRLRRDIDA